MRKVLVENFRENVKQLLQERNMSRSDLARTMGVSPAYVTQLLTGSHEPGLRVVEKVAVALEVCPQDLLKSFSQVA